MLTHTDGPAIAAAFGLARPVTLEGPVARGQLGQVWRLRVGGTSFAVKEWFASPDVAAVEEDARFAEEAHAAGVLTPRVRRSVDGRVVAVVGGTHVRVSEWVDLQPRTRDVDPAAVGRTLALLHGVGKPSEAPVDSWFSSGVGEPAWRDLHQRVVEERAPFASDLGALLDDLVAVERVVEPHEQVRVCHRDLWADNVLRGADGRIYVIDFENLGPADPSQELAMVLFEFGADDPSRVRRLNAAYVGAGGPARVTRRGHFTMLVAQQAHIAALACARWVGESDPVERRRLASWFLELPQDPVTLPRIDRILAALP